METTENNPAEVQETKEEKKAEAKQEKKETYDPVKVDSIRRLLEMQAQRGKPFYYKIIIDEVEAVPKTCDIEKFDNHQKYLQGAGELTVNLYGTADTPRIKLKRIFTLDNDSKRPAKPQDLNGMESESKIEERMRKTFEHELLKRDLLETQKKLSDAEEYIDELENKLERERDRSILLEKERDIKDKKWGQVASGMLEGVVRRNPHFLKKFGPTGEALAGLIEEDNIDREKAKQADTTSQGEASFSEAPATLTEEEREILAYFKEMQERFGEELAEDVMHIIEYLSTHKNEIKTVVQLLGIKKQ